MTTNPTLKDAAYQIIKTPVPTQFYLEMKFYSETDETFTYIPLIVDAMTIVQDFSKTYVDNITTQFRISSSDYLLLFDHSRDLMCYTKMTYLDTKASTIVYDPVPVARTYRAVIIDPIDIRSQIKDAHNRITPDQQIKIQLIEAEAYSARHAQFHGTFKGTTVDGFLKYVSKSFGIDSVIMTPPDNSHTHGHLVIPPAKGFDVIYGYIQDRYGVYMKGLRHYYTGGSLYIYPPYECKPKTHMTVNMYKVEQGDFAGSSSFHRLVDDKTLEIVLSGETSSADHRTIGAENVGAAKMLLRSSQTIDGYAETTNAGTTTNDDASMILKLKGGRLNSSKESHVRYDTTTDNVFASASDMANYQTKVISTVWGQAIPYLMTPGTAIQYIHDETGSMKIEHGILDGALYHIEKGHKGAGGYVYSCKSQLRIRLDSDTE